MQRLCNVLLHDQVFVYLRNFVLIYRTFDSYDILFHCNGSQPVFLTRRAFGLMSRRNAITLSRHQRAKSSRIILFVRRGGFHLCEELPVKELPVLEKNTRKRQLFRRQTWDTARRGGGHRHAQNEFCPTQFCRLLCAANEQIVLARRKIASKRGLDTNDVP